MSEASTRSLARWRDQVVARETAEQAAARCRWQAATRLVEAAASDLHRALQAQRSARVSQVEARTPADLAWGEHRARALSMLVLRAEARLRVAETVRIGAQTSIDVATVRVRDAELDRRAVSLRLERWKQSRQRVAERNAEAEAEDLHRARLPRTKIG